MESSNKGGGVAKVCSPQTGLWFVTLLRGMYARIRTYHVRSNTFGEKKKFPPEVRSRDGHTCRTCAQKFRSISYITSRTHRIFCGKHAYFRWLLVITWFYPRSGFCVIFHFRFTVGRSDSRMFAWNLLRTDMPSSTCSRLVQTKMEKKRFSYGNAWPFLALLMACGRWGYVVVTSANP